MRILKRSILILGSMVFIFMAAACGKKDEPVKKPIRQQEYSDITVTPEEELKKNANIKGWTDETDSYEYPSGDYGDGFNYGKLRGRWQTDIDVSMQDIFDDNTTEYKQMMNILAAMGTKVPSGTKKMIIRFTDDSHIEGRIIQDNNAFYDMIMEIFGSREGIMQYCSILYGVSYGMVDYALAQQGTTPQEMADTMQTVFKLAAGPNKKNLIQASEFSATYVLRDNNVILNEIDMTLSYNEDGTLSVYSGANCAKELASADGTVLTKK